MTKKLVESIANKDKNSYNYFMAEVASRIASRIDEIKKDVFSDMFIVEYSTHEWFRSLSSEQQKEYLTLHPKSELKKYFKVTSDGKVVMADDDKKQAPQKIKPPKEEKKISDVKVPQKKEEPKQVTAPEDEVESGQKKSEKPQEEISLADLRAKQKPTEDYDKTPAKEVKGETAQEILAKSGSPTDMTGPDAESGKEGSDAEFERELIAGLTNLSKQVKEFKTRKKEAEAAGKEFTEEPPKFELCQISVPGTNLFCQNNIGVPRDDMPQLSGTPIEGSKADSLQRGADGGVSIEKQFKEKLEQDEIGTKPRKVDVATLKATQTNLAGEKIAGMLETLKNDPANEALNAPIYVSKDGYILDGHHRWAALLSLGIADGLDEPVAMNVVEVDMGIEDLLDYTNKFADDMGIQKKKAGETTGENKPKPKLSEEKKMPPVYIIPQGSGKHATPDKLPENAEKYFVVTPDAITVKLKDLKTIRARPEGIANAEINMANAYNGYGTKRKPISLKDNGDGTYTVLDGNSTTAIAKKHGWKSIVGIVEVGKEITESRNKRVEAAINKIKIDNEKLLKFINELRASPEVQINPFYGREFYYTFEEDGAVLVELTPFDGYVHLSSIRTSPHIKKKGYATEVMKKIIEKADEDQIPLGLSPIPFGEGKTTKATLVKWYKKLGFKPRDGGTSYMVYEPKK